MIPDWTVIENPCYPLRTQKRMEVSVSSINITNARKDFYKIVQAVNDTHEPMHITGKGASAVLIGEDDWRSIVETLYLSSIPGMRESILEGMKTPVEKLSKHLNW